MTTDPVTLCFGCRADTEAPLGPADRFGPFPDGQWERFKCERCGVEDIRPRTYRTSLDSEVDQ